jgi:cell division protease FtsH
VGSFGMAGSLISYDAVQAGHGNAVAKVLSNDEGRARVEEILDSAKAAVRTMLEGSSHVVEALRDALLDREELVAEEITEVIRVAEGGVIDLREQAELELGW